MKLIDTHTHLYLADFKDDIDAVIQRSIDAGIQKFYLPAIDRTELDPILELEKKFPGKCFAMMGLHPCSVKENYKDELQIVQGLLEKRKFAAIGEIGLDFYWDTTFTEQQYESFHIQIHWALQYDLPIVIHSRNATRECVDVVKGYQDKGLRGIFHCFSDNHMWANEIIKTGFYLGIGGVVTYKNSGLAEVLKQVDLKHIVLETDSPYLTPVPFRGKRNENSYLKYVAQKIAEIKNVSVEEVAEITSANAEKIFIATDH